MSNTPVFTKEQLHFLSEQLFDKQSDMFSYNLKTSKRKALLAELFHASNFDALIQRSPSSLSNEDEPVDVYYQWMFPKGEEGDQTYVPFKPTFYNQPLEDKFAHSDDALAIINDKSKFMLDKEDLYGAELIKLTCHKVTNPISNDIFSNDIDKGKQVDTPPSPLMKLMKWVRDEGHLDSFDADSTKMYMANNLLYIYTEVNHNEKSSIRVENVYIHSKDEITCKTFVKMIEPKTGTVLISSPMSADITIKENKVIFDINNNYEEIILNSHFEHAHELMVQIHNRISCGY
jgi:hypothetical protein